MRLPAAVQGCARGDAGRGRRGPIDAMVPAVLSANGAPTATGEPCRGVRIGPTLLRPHVRGKGPCGPARYGDRCAGPHVDGAGTGPRDPGPLRARYGLVLQPVTTPARDSAGASGDP